MDYVKRSKRLFPGIACVEINQFDTIRFYNELDQLHNENGPAVIWPDGYKLWYWCGQIHRRNGPAEIRADGTIEYYIHGEWISKIDFDKLISSN